MHKVCHSLDTFYHSLCIVRYKIDKVCLTVTIDEHLVECIDSKAFCHLQII